MKTWTILVVGALAGTAACGGGGSTDGGTPMDTGAADTGTPTDTGTPMGDGGGDGGTPCLTEMNATPRCPMARAANDMMRPNFRIAQIELVQPAALASPIVGGIINGALARGLFLWGISMDLGGNMLRTGALNGAMITRGTVGQGLLDGTFRYHSGDAPMGGAAGRWDSVTVPLMNMAGVYSSGMPMGTLRLPIYSSAMPGMLLTELPLENARMTALRPSDDRGCIGVAQYRMMRFNECASNAWCTRVDCAMDGMPYGQVQADIATAAADMIRLTDVPGMPTLCQFIAGITTTCAMSTMPPAMWANPPDAMVNGMPAFHLVANFAAVSANISNAR
jgi:hypothetical protein